MDHTLGLYVITYYAFLAVAASANSWFIAPAVFMFILMSIRTDVELIPGIETALEAQIQILKTQYWLSKEGYY